MTTVNNQHTIETGHKEMIHDCQLDYYGKRLATASSDRTVKIFEVSEGKTKLLRELSGHDGPVWQVAWSHPQYQSLLATCSYDRKVFVWKEEGENRWIRVFEDTNFSSSVNSVAWAPHRAGLILAAASSDGTVAVFTYDENEKRWLPQRLTAHLGGANAVSWSPDIPRGDLLNAQAPNRVVKRFVTGGCDNKLRIWGCDASGNWKEEKVFANDSGSHDDWIRDVAWAPNVGLPKNTIASCGEDGVVKIWTEKRGLWSMTCKLPFKDKVWKLSWSQMGNILAVSTGDNQVTLWKEALNGKWEQISYNTK